LVREEAVDNRRKTFYFSNLQFRTILKRGLA
jgi:hypothetical protein